MLHRSFYLCLGQHYLYDRNRTGNNFQLFFDKNAPQQQQQQQSTQITPPKQQQFQSNRQYQDDEEDDSVLVDSILPRVMEAVNDSFLTEDDVRDAIRKNNYDLNSTVSDLLDKLSGKPIYIHHLSLFC